MEILVIKVGAMGDVLRTTSILPGLAARHPGARVSWVVAEGSRDLVRFHPLVARAIPLDPRSPNSVEAVARDLSGAEWGRILSLDDEPALCELAARLSRTAAPGVLSGAHLDREGRPAYTPDTAPWFDMGLISVHGKEEADRLKKENTEGHPEILARMLGLAKGRPELPLPDSARAFGTAFSERMALDAKRPVIGMNTGAGGRWQSKRLPVDRTVQLMEELGRRLPGGATFLLLGGQGEAERNAEIAGLASGLTSGTDSRVRLVDAGTSNDVLSFAALVRELDLLVTSDSLALHVAVALGVPLVAFFAPTSAAEIDLYGLGEKVVSTAPDACSYRPEADTSTLTVARLAAAAERVLTRPGKASAG